MQKNPDDFTTPKKVRYHWGGTWECIKPPTNYRWVGGKYVDRLTIPRVTLADVVNMVRILAGENTRCQREMFLLAGEYRSFINHEVQFNIWWTSEEPDSEGLYIYTLFCILI